jgi:hypothetical protein
VPIRELQRVLAEIPEDTPGSAFIPGLILLMEEPLSVLDKNLRQKAQ